MIYHRGPSLVFNKEIKTLSFEKLDEFIVVSFEKPNNMFLKTFSALKSSILERVTLTKNELLEIRDYLIKNMEEIPTDLPSSVAEIKIKKEDDKYEFCLVSKLKNVDIILQDTYKCYSLLLEYDEVVELINKINKLI